MSRCLGTFRMLLKLGAPIKRHSAPQDLVAMARKRDSVKKRKRRKDHTDRIYKRKKIRKDDTDRISEFPELVLHLILSFLPIKTAARTSILSKRWRYLWDTLPYLDFGVNSFNVSLRLYSPGEVWKHNKISLDIIDRIMLRRSERPDSSIEKFCFEFLKIHGETSFACLRIERWISRVAGRSLKEFILSNTRAPFDYLPSTIHQGILSARSLNVLNLCGLNLGSWSSLDIKFPSLRELKLHQVLLDDVVLRNLIRGCPAIEDLHLNVLSVLKSVCVTGLLKLKLLNLSVPQNKDEIRIDAPELQSLTVHNITRLCRLKVMNSCTRIKKLWLYGSFMTSECLHQIVSKCFFLENLVILVSSGVESIKISSDTLKTLAIWQWHDLVDVDINAPALESFTFKPRILRTFLLNIPNTINVRLEYWESDIRIIQYFLGCFSNFQTVTLYFNGDSLFSALKWRDSLFSALGGTRNLVFASYESNIFELVVELMLCLSPRANTLKITRLGLTVAFIKLRYDQNCVVENSSLPCCKSLSMRCWRHYLTEVRIEQFAGDGDEMTKTKNFFLEHVKDVKIVD